VVTSKTVNNTQYGNCLDAALWCHKRRQCSWWAWCDSPMRLQRYMQHTSLFTIYVAPLKRKKCADKHGVTVYPRWFLSMCRLRLHNEEKRRTSVVQDAHGEDCFALMHLVYRILKWRSQFKDELSCYICAFFPRMRGMGSLWEFIACLILSTPVIPISNRPADLYHISYG
jgi:hypothetical protein